jgi:hypothetical protein
LLLNLLAYKALFQGCGYSPALACFKSVFISEDKWFDNFENLACHAVESEGGSLGGEKMEEKG